MIHKSKVLVYGGNSQIFSSWLQFTKIHQPNDFFYLSRQRRALDSGATWLGPISSNIPKGSFDLIVNFVGASDPNEIRDGRSSLFRAMKISDLQALEAADRGAHYIYISSGAVHQSLPAAGGPPKPWATTSPYIQEKLRAELGHLAASSSTSDLRVFGFLGGPKSIAPGTLLGDLYDAWVCNSPFRTGPAQTTRDYSGPLEIAAALDALSLHSPKGAFDLYSRGAAEKKQLAKALGLKVETSPTSSPDLSPTGAKSEYFSTDLSLSKLGYAPTRDSAQIVVEQFSLMKNTPT